jgi:hypothetical protein
VCQNRAGRISPKGGFYGLFFVVGKMWRFLVFLQGIEWNIGLLRKIGYNIVFWGIS